MWIFYLTMFQSKLIPFLIIFRVETINGMEPIINYSGIRFRGWILNGAQVHFSSKSSPHHSIIILTSHSISITHASNRIKSSISRQFHYSCSKAYIGKGFIMRMGIDDGNRRQRFWQNSHSVYTVLFVLSRICDGMKEYRIYNVSSFRKSLVILLNLKYWIL